MVSRMRKTPEVLRSLLLQVHSRTSRYAFATGTLALSVAAVAWGVACNHNKTDANSADSSPQPTEDQLMQIADDVALNSYSADSGYTIDSIGGTGDDSDGGSSATASNDDSGAAPATPPAATPGPGGAEVGSGAAPALPAGWAMLTATPCGLTVNMPVAPNEDDKTGDPAHQYKYIIPGAVDGAYSVSCTDFPNGIGGAQGWLNSLRDKLDGNGGKITAETPMTLSGNPGREYRVTLPGGGTHIARAFLLPKKSIILIVGGAPNAIAGADAQSFLGSARLTH